MAERMGAGRAERADQAFDLTGNIAKPAIDFVPIFVPNFDPVERALLEFAI